MKTFNIFLAIRPIFEEVEDQDRKYAGTITATDLDHAYSKGQNIDRYWNNKKPCRSVSVGDVIEDAVKNELFLVCNMGFRQLQS